METDCLIEWVCDDNSLIDKIFRKGDKMKCFQIEKGEVLIINGDKLYTDNIENFKLDSGIKSMPVRVWYSDEQSNVVIKQDTDSKEIWKKYPLREYDDYIATIDDYIDAKAQREYTPPTMDELKEKEQARQDVAQTPSLDERITVLEDAVDTLMEGVATNG